MARSTNGVPAAAGQVKQTLSDTGRVVADQAGEVKQALTDSGRAVAAQAGEVKQALVDSGRTVAASAGEVKEQVAATATLAKDRAGEVVHALADQVPSDRQQWESLGRDVRDSVRRNPAPWIAGAAVVGFVWWLGRRSK